MSQECTSVSHDELMMIIITISNTKAVCIKMQLNQFKGRQRECMFPEIGTSTLNHLINILVKRSGGIERLFLS